MMRINDRSSKTNHGNWYIFLGVMVILAGMQIWHSVILSSLTAATSATREQMILENGSSLSSNLAHTADIVLHNRTESASSIQILKNPTAVSTTNDLNKPATTSIGQLERFLAQYPDSSGARFVNLLRNHLHARGRLETSRITACEKSVRGSASAKDMIHCFSGESVVNVTQMDDDKNRFMPLDSNISVHDMPCYPGTDKWIPFLGTIYTCLPLFLAGAAVGSQNMALELGPYFGFSSKCIVAGLKTNGVRENSYIAFDTFEGSVNYNSILNNQKHNWLLKAHPEFNENATSFLSLWEEAVQPIYPTAEGRAGFISKATLNYSTIGLDDMNTREIDLISIDSAKSVGGLKSQLAGLGRIHAGTILFLLDFEFVAEQVKLVYGCMRHSGYLLPVYTAWANHENWAFVVTRDFSFSEFSFPACIQQEGVNHTYWVEQDLRLLASLRTDDAPDESTQLRIDQLSDKLLQLLEP